MHAPQMRFRTLLNLFNFFWSYRLTLPALPPKHRFSDFSPRTKGEEARPQQENTDETYISALEPGTQEPPRFPLAHGYKSWS